MISPASADLELAGDTGMTRPRIAIILGMSALIGFFIWRRIQRTPTEADVRNHRAIPSAETPAAVAHIKRGRIEDTLTIAGAFKPFQDVDIHAKVAGYIKTIYVDVGDHVKGGQRLAILEVPELQAQVGGTDADVRRAREEIRRAQADVERAKSKHVAAHDMYVRLSQAAAQKEGLVAQQEVDDTEAKDLGSAAQLSGAQAAYSAAQQALEVAEARQKQYEALSNYTRIAAPFAGVITKRYADTGTLVAAGTSSSTQAIPVVRLAQVSKLRLVLPIPESIAAQIHLGDPVKVRVQALNKDFVGKISRFADSLDMQTRTMETEIDFENSSGLLIPGMYTETVLQVSGNQNALLVPLEAVTQNKDDATVLALDSNNVVQERHIKLGIQGKQYVEVIAGLAEGDRVIIGNRSQFHGGQHVQPKEIGAGDLTTGEDN
jgi:RND family efflux transporter MFP subunit